MPELGVGPAALQPRLEQVRVRIRVRVRARVRARFRVRVRLRVRVRVRVSSMPVPAVKLTSPRDEPMPPWPNSVVIRIAS